MKTMVYTQASDVWAFGITVLEIFTDAATPYADIFNVNELITKLDNGWRAARPPTCPPSVYEVMLQMWSKEPEDRCSFGELEEFFFSQPCEDLRTLKPRKPMLASRSAVGASTPVVAPPDGAVPFADTVATSGPNAAESATIPYVYNRVDVETESAAVALPYVLTPNATTTTALAEVPAAFTFVSVARNNNSRWTRAPADGVALSAEEVAVGGEESGGASCAVETRSEMQSNAIACPMGASSSSVGEFGFGGSTGATHSPDVFGFATHSGAGAVPNAMISVSRGELCNTAAKKTPTKRWLKPKSTKKSATKTKPTGWFGTRNLQVVYSDDDSLLDSDHDENMLDGTM
jgi:hypothetical protein